MANANTKFLVSRIEQELRRLDSLEAGHGDVVVLADDTLPDGWVRIGDEVATVYGPSWEILEHLEDALPDETIDPQNPYDRMGDHRGYEALWNALRDEYSREPDAEIWRKYHEFVQGIHIGSMGLLVFRTNAGLQWGFAPTDPEYLAFNSTHDYSPWFHSAEVAMDAAAEFDARIMAETRLSDEWPYKGNQHDTDLSRGDSRQRRR